MVPSGDLTIQSYITMENRHLQRVKPSNRMSHVHVPYCRVDLHTMEDMCNEV